MGCTGSQTSQMNIKRDWIIDFDEDQFIEVQGEGFTRLLKGLNRRDEWKAALAEAHRLIQPAAVWDSFAIREMHHEKLLLASGVSIGGGPVTTVVAGATDLIVAVCTIGPDVERRAGALQRSNKMFQAMMLSDLGSWAVDSLRQKLCQWLMEDSAHRGLRVSASLSPGESEWSVKDQSTIFSLIDSSSIGVSLSPSLVMSPIKSLSLIMGTGAQSMGVEGSSNCDFCTLRDRCNFRILR
jgi:hypothetical protein